MAKTLTVHMIGNAHLDPVWMWTWPFGMDEAINTTRTMCDLLDEYPELVVTRGEAWVYEQVRRLAPDMFERVKAHVHAGRWAVVNGWWVQPDTNHPSAESFVKQGQIGKGWLSKHLGVDVLTGYQVDSFGHTAMLPAFLRAVGMENYLFSRPSPQQMALPGELFHWSAPTGESVVAYRIQDSYCARGNDTLEKNLEAAIAAADRTIGHAICFYGIGDHGGGPSREQIEWILDHRQYRDDVRLVFSHPDAFFAAVRASGVELPTHTGEMQFVFSGCHTVVHRMRQQMRRAETLAAQAEALVAAMPDVAPVDANEDLHQAWTRILFNQFHDILAGTSIEPAYEDTSDELGFARMTARRIIGDVTRRQTLTLPPCPQQRLVLHNITDRPFSGWLETEPWLGNDSGVIPVRYVDSDGDDLLIQTMAGHAAEKKMWRYLVHADVPAYSHRVIEIHHDREATPEPRVHAKAASVANDVLTARASDKGVASLVSDKREMLGGDGMRLISLADPSDTWGGGLESCRFDGPMVGTFGVSQPWRAIADGPVRAAISAELTLNRTHVLWRVFVNADEPVLRMRLRVNFSAEHEVLKLVIPPAFSPVERTDGVPGARIARATDGRDYPIFNHLSVHNGASGLAAVSADVFGGDVQPDGTIRLTLLRSPNYTHARNFNRGVPDKHVYALTDQGEHVFDIAVLPTADPAAIDAEVHRQSEPIWISETTHGMPPRHHTGQFRGV